MTRLSVLIVSAVLIVGGFIWLMFLDWKIGLAIGSIVWGSEIFRQIDDIRTESDDQRNY